MCPDNGDAEAPAAAAPGPTGPAAPAPQPNAPARPRRLWPRLTGLFAFWLLLFAICYGMSAFSLTLAAGFLLVAGFAISTWIFHGAKDLISKRFVKALDYFTILTFVTGIVATAEIDTQTIRKNAEDASKQIGTIQSEAQDLLRPQLAAHCLNPRTFSIPKDLNSTRLTQFAENTRAFVFCRLFSYPSGEDLSRVPLEQVQLSLSFGYYALITNLLPDRDLTRKTLEAVSRYTATRGAVERGNPIGAYLSKTVAFLLVAFAFAIRLTRTTLEVFEWHR